MDERTFIFGEYNTWTDWGLILTSKEIMPPKVKTNYVDIDGMSGSLDLSEALSGEPTYSNREIKTDFCATEGTVEEREELLRNITAMLHGRRMKIQGPDDHNHYFYGRVSVSSVENYVTCSVISITAECEPWRYAADITELSIPVTSATALDVQILNRGVKTVCPEITITGSVTFTCNGITSNGTTGVYKVLTFKLYAGHNTIAVSGSGTMKLTYREAIL